jgi:predicted amidohydrolase YtcJ
MMRVPVLIILVGVLMLTCQKGKQPADTVYKNGRIWTVNSAQPWVSVLGVRGEWICYAGDEMPAAADLIGDSTRVIDLENRFVLPGMIDAHLHLMDGGLSLSRIDLRSCRSKMEFIQRIADYVKKIPAGEWILDGNWDHTLWPGESLPERSWIDAVTPAHPVFINRLDGHMALANSLALKMAGIDTLTETPLGGVIVKDGSGNLTGILKDAAMGLVGRIIPEPGKEYKLKAVENAEKYLLQNGITSVHDMGSLTDLEIYRELIGQNKLNLRITAYIPVSRWEELKSMNIADADPNRLKVNGVKGFMDGSLGSGTAKFFKAYANDPANTGVWDEQAIPPDKMYIRLKAADSLGKQVAVHAIGDEANAVLLGFYSSILAADPNRRDRRFRIEHAQHLCPEDIAVFAHTGVIASMQPYHCIDDGRWAEERIGIERCRTTYAFRSLLDNQAKLAFGSDWYVAPASPLWGIYAAVTRRTLDDKNPDGWIPEQKITVEEAIRCYTINGAYAEFSEKYKGSLETGKLADFVVLSDDLLRIDPVKIKDVRVVKTVAGGKTVYAE